MLKKLEELHEAKNKLITNLNHELDKDIKQVDTKEASDVADMIKDLSEAEKSCWEACYYQSICCAMAEAEGSEGSMGYDNWRYSSGRFAPKGSGHYAGYNFPPMSEFPRHPEMIYRMGYGNSGGGNGGSSGGSNSYSGGGRRGYNYDQYSQARRHFHETGDMGHKQEMNEKAREYMAETAESIKEMMIDADPELKKKLKSDLANLLSEMS